MKFINGEIVPENQKEADEYATRVSLANNNQPQINNDNEIIKQQNADYKLSHPDTPALTPEQQREQEINTYDPETQALIKSNESIAGSLKIGAESAVNELLFGLPKTIYNHTASDKDIKQQEALEHFHSTANIAGGIGGALGSLLYGGEFFKGAQVAGKFAEGAVLGGKAAEEASFARALASKIVGGTAEGAVLGAPKSAVDLAFGDPKEAAENLLFSAGIGGIVGPASWAFKGLAEKGLEVGSAKLEGLSSKLTDELNSNGEGLKEGAKDRLKEAIGEKIKDIAKDAGLYAHGVGGKIIGSAIGTLASTIAKKALDVIPEEFITKGLNATLSATSLANEQIAKIPEILDQLSTSGFGKAAKAAPNVLSNAGKDIAEHDGDDQKQFKAFSEKLANNSATQNDQQILGHNAAGLNHNQEIQNAYSQNSVNILNYIKENIPKNPNKFQMFSTNEWKPTPEQIQNFNSKLDIINNPYIVLDKLKNGTVSKEDMDELKTLYPATYNKITQSILSYGADSKYAKMPYNVKTKLSIVTGMAIDPSFSPQNIKMLQSDFNSSNASKSPDQLGGKEQGSLKNINKLPTGATTVDKISTGSLS